MIRNRRGSTAVMPLVAAALLSACAGPQAKVTIAGKQVPLSVAFGKPHLPAGSTPQQPTTVVPAPSGVGVIEIPTPGPTVIPDPLPSGLKPPAACPKPAPGSAAAEAAPSTTNGVPKAATTLLRVERSTTDPKGTVTSKGTGVLTTSAPTTSPSGATTFTATLTMFGTTSETEYETVPASYSGPVQANSGMIAIRYLSGDGGLGFEQSFRPTSPLQVFSQPAYAGAAWTSASTDPLNRSVAQVSGQVVAEEPIAACGAVVDAWRTETTVHVTNPNQDITTTVTTWFATQHGGVPLQQTQAYSGTAGGEAVSGTTTWVVNADVWTG